MAEAHVAIKQIARRIGRSRKLVRAVLRNTEDEVFRSRTSSLAPWPVALDTAWSEGCRNGAELWRRVCVSPDPPADGRRLWLMWGA
jgi:transposase